MARVRSQHVGWGLLLAVLALGVALRCAHLGGRSIWFDEAFSWRLIQYPPGEMLYRVTLDNNLPLYFVLLKAWAACFGDSLWALRSLSVLFGGMAIVAMFLFVREAVRWSPNYSAMRTRATETGLLAALFLAISVFHVRWCWEARCYAVGTALVLLTSWTLLRALRRRHAGRWWCAYGVLALLFTYTHYFAWFSLAVQGGFALWVLWQAGGGSFGGMLRARGATWAAGVFTLLALGWLPWLPFFLQQLTQVREDFWIPPLRQWDLAHTCYRMFVDPASQSLSQTASLWALDLCVLGWVGFLWRASRVAVFVAASALFPVVAAVLLDRLGVHLFLLRYFLFAHTFFLAALAMLLSRWFAFALERRILAGLLVAWGLFALWAFYDGVDLAHHPGTQGAAAWIRREGEPDEPVIVNSAFSYLPLLYHLRERGACYLYQHDAHVPHYLGAAVLKPEDHLSHQQLDRMAPPRVWFVESTNRAGAVSEFPPAGSGQLLERRCFPEVFSLGDIIVYHYGGVSDDPTATTGTGTSE